MNSNTRYGNACHGSRPPFSVVQCLFWIMSRRSEGSLFTSAVHPGADIRKVRPNGLLGARSGHYSYWPKPRKTVGIYYAFVSGSSWPVCKPLLWLNTRNWHGSCLYQSRSGHEPLCCRRRFPPRLTLYRSAGSVLRKCEATGSAIFGIRALNQSAMGGTAVNTPVSVAEHGRR